MPQSFKKYTPYVISTLLISVSLYIRITFIEWRSVDMKHFLLPWYNIIQRGGILVPLGQTFSNYTPPYLYLLAIATLTLGVIPKVTAIKLISIFFDVYAGLVVLRLIGLKYPKSPVPYLGASIFFALPTIIINSSIWGQADSIYTAFLLTSVYFLVKEDAFKAVLFFSLAFAFKQQAIFLTPLLVILTLNKKIPWFYYFLVPVVYMVLMIPSVYLGRSWQDVLSIYFSQASKGTALSKNAPNLYILVSRSAYPLIIKPALIAGFLSIAAWIALTWRTLKKPDGKTLLLLALISLSLAPFVLPKMHERYFYPADALSLAVAFWMPGLWAVPVLFQISSGLSYMPFLAQTPVLYVKAGAFINLFILVWLLIKQITLSTQGSVPDSPSPPSQPRGVE